MLWQGGSIDKRTTAMKYQPEQPATCQICEPEVEAPCLEAAVNTK